jgi:hypothetical protein
MYILRRAGDVAAAHIFDLAGDHACVLVLTHRQVLRRDRPIRPRVVCSRMRASGRYVLGEYRQCATWSAPGLDLV